MTANRDAETGQFLQGASGNPSGRPKGSRNKLGEAFIQALFDDFTAHGVATIEKARLEDPVGYVRVCAGILPKELKIDRTDELTDEQLDARIRQLASIIGVEIGAAGPAATAGEPAEAKPAGKIPAVH